MDKDRQRLEPGWAAVVLAALVYSGHIVLAVPGRKLDALSLGTLAATPLEELTRFKHIERPKDWNLPALSAVFELLGLAPGTARSVAQGNEDAVKHLQREIGTRVEDLVLAQQQLRRGLLLWGKSLLSENEVHEFHARLDGTKAFLESLQAYTTLGKLENFKHDAPEVIAHRPGLDALVRIRSIETLRTDIDATAAYLSAAEAGLPDGHEWVGRVKTAQHEVLAEFSNPSKRDETTFRQRTTRSFLKRWMPRSSSIDREGSTQPVHRRRVPPDRAERAGRNRRKGNLPQLAAARPRAAGDRQRQGEEIVHSLPRA